MKLTEKNVKSTAEKVGEVFGKLIYKLGVLGFGIAVILTIIKLSIGTIIGWWGILAISLTGLIALLAYLVAIGVFWLIAMPIALLIDWIRGRAK